MVGRRIALRPWAGRGTGQQRSLCLARGHHLATAVQAVILDFRLPDMHDLSLLATLRQLLPEARLILMTAFGTPDVATDANLLGATVVNKPFDLDVVASLVLGIPRGPE